MYYYDIIIIEILLVSKTKMNKQIKGNKTSSKGFTLIELVVVIGILAVLFAIVLIAINPGRQFAQANDTKRRSDANAILNAVSQYTADKGKGALPGGIGTSATDVGGKTLGVCTLIVPQYIAALPVDGGASLTTCPDNDTTTTGYTIKAEGTRITVAAVKTDVDGKEISVTR